MKKNSTQFVPWIIVALMILFIFSNSLVPATGSKAMSSSFTHTIYNWLNDVGFHIDFEFLHYLIRKSAHFLEYAVLGSLICFANHVKPLVKNSYYPVLCFLLVPIIDETIQRFIPGRSSEFGDMLIDASGMITGFCFTLLILTLLVKILNNRKKAL